MQDDYVSSFLRGEDVEPESNLQHVFNVIRESINQIRLLEHRIVNQEEERKRFLRSSEYKPQPEFREFEHDIARFHSLLNEAAEICREAENDTSLDDELIEFIFIESLEELKTHASLMNNLENENLWKSYSKEIWGEPDKKRADECRKKCRELSSEDESKLIKPSKLQKMFSNELERLGIDYDTEIRNVRGSHNLPGEKKLIVSSGIDGNRMYNLSEAKALTVHETFHVARAHNGYKFSENIGLPPLLGVFTAGYDTAEEGGAVLREKVTGVLSEAREHDYRCKVVAAHLSAECSSFEEDFEQMISVLTDLGYTQKRAFDVLFRNRQAIRHHTYWCGQSEWKDYNRDGLMLGKVGKATAEKIYDDTACSPDVPAQKVFEKKKKEEI